MSDNFYTKDARQSRREYILFEYGHRHPLRRPCDRLSATTAALLRCVSALSSHHLTPVRLFSKSFRGLSVTSPNRESRFFWPSATAVFIPWFRAVSLGLASRAIFVRWSPRPQTIFFSFFIGIFHCELKKTGLLTRPIPFFGTTPGRNRCFRSPRFFPSARLRPLRCLCRPSAPPLFFCSSQRKWAAFRKSAAEKSSSAALSLVSAGEAQHVLRWVRVRYPFDVTQNQRIWRKLYWKRK